MFQILYSARAHAISLLIEENSCCFSKTCCQFAAVTFRGKILKWMGWDGMKRCSIQHNIFTFYYSIVEKVLSFHFKKKVGMQMRNYNKIEGHGRITLCTENLTIVHSFQYDAYRPLRWPPLDVSTRGCTFQRGEYIPPHHVPCLGVSTPPYIPNPRHTTRIYTHPPGRDLGPGTPPPFVDKQTSEKLPFRNFVGGQ